MIVFELNAVPYGSTGRIMFQIAQTAEQQGITVYTANSYTKNRGEKYPTNHLRVGGVAGKLLHTVLAQATGRHGQYSRFATHRLLVQLKKIRPNVIHLHNIHGWYLNWQMLFDYFKESKIPVVWTLHDCWSFTGHCPHFTAVKCNKWKTKCNNCPLYAQYPGCRFDDSELQFRYKKQCFTNVPNLTIVTPSQWLAQLVKQSYLQEYNTIVINNGIDLSKFHPRKSSFRQQHGLVNKFVLLGVAFDLDERKGLSTFKRLALDLPSSYAVVLVGVSQTVKDEMPDNVVCVARTQSQEELAEIYTAADVFLNPTIEDNFPTVNMEALACGTPVITYDTGGSPESLTEKCGVVVPYGDYERFRETCVEVCKQHVFTSDDCVAQSKKFDANSANMKYIELYKSLCQ